MIWDNIEAYPIVGTDTVGPDIRRVDLSSPVGVEVRALVKAAQEATWSYMDINSTDVFERMKELNRCLIELRAKVGA